MKEETTAFRHIELTIQDLAMMLNGNTMVVDTRDVILVEISFKEENKDV